MAAFRKSRGDIRLRLIELPRELRSCSTIGLGSGVRRILSVILPLLLACCVTGCFAFPYFLLLFKKRNNTYLWVLLLGLAVVTVIRLAWFWVQSRGLVNGSNPHRHCHLQTTTARFDIGMSLKVIGESQTPSSLSIVDS